MAASITPIQAFSLGADAVYLSKRPLPTAPDGHYDWENQADTSLSPQAHAGVTSLVNTVRFIKVPSVISTYHYMTTAVLPSFCLTLKYAVL